MPNPDLQNHIAQSHTKSFIVIFLTSTLLTVLLWFIPTSFELGFDSDLKFNSNNPRDAPIIIHYNKDIINYGWPLVFKTQTQPTQPGAPKLITEFNYTNLPIDIFIYCVLVFIIYRHFGFWWKKGQKIVALLSVPVTILVLFLIVSIAYRLAIDAYSSYVGV